MRILITAILCLFTSQVFCQTKSMYKTESINKEIADSLKAYELTNRAFTNIALTFTKGNNDLKSQLANKSIEERTLYYVTILDMQVLNGGIYQFFSNYGNQYDSEIINALETIERRELATSFKEICPFATKEFEQVKGDYDKFDKSYYENNMKKSMDEHLKEYIIANIVIFEIK
jgi:hypothetical protein